jgi:hypothetical protein
MVADLSQQRHPARLGNRLSRRMSALNCPNAETRCDALFPTTEQQVVDGNREVQFVNHRDSWRVESAELAMFAFR